MGALVAALSRCDNDVIPLVVTMLKTLSHRGTSNYEIVTPTKAVSAESLEELEERASKPSGVSIGRCMPSVTLSQGAPPSVAKEYAMLLEGQIFPRSLMNCIGAIMTREGHTLEEGAKRLLTDFEGAYTFAIASANHMLIGRDTLGTKALYYGASSALCAVATERKALWEVGVKEAYSFPPGNLADVSRRGFAFEPVRIVKQQPQRKLEMNHAARRLQKLLAKSVLKRVCDVEKVGIAFSGGLDSSVIACLAQRCGVAVNLISVGLEGQPELILARKAADSLGLPKKLKRFKVNEVEKALSKVLWLIEEPDLMKVGVAIPFFWTAQIASRLGLHVLLAGQGADELFGGYRRYLTTYASGGAEEVAEALYQDTVLSYRTNFQRDEPVCAFHKVDLRLPFADTDVVRFALALPVRLKINSASDGLRKRVLRQVAFNLGIPAFIAEKPKKAVQFATGVDGAVRSLAKSKGLTGHRYVEEAFKRVYANSGVRYGEHGDLLFPEIS